MAMANLLLKPSSMIIALKSSKQSSSRSKRSFLYTPPTSSFTLPLSYGVQSGNAAEPISALFKEHKGFGGNMNWSDFSGSSLSSFWDDIAQIDEKPSATSVKFQCQWAKDGTVAETEDDKRTEKRKIHKRIFSFAHPKHHASRHMVVPYSDLVGGIRDGSVVRVQFVENSRKIYYNTKSSGDQDAETPQTQSGSTGLLKASVPKWQYHTRNVGDDKHHLIRMMKDQGITYGSDPELFSGAMKNVLFAMLQLAPYWIMVLLSFYQLNGQLSLGRMTKRKPSKKQSVTFDDVEGVDDAKAELLEIVLCIKGDSKYMKLGAVLPRGVLLAGPPGTGKTLLARAVAGEAGVSFFSISASELVEVFVGTGAARVRDLFREARKSSPSIIFIDEIDAVGGQRGRTLNCERDQTLNQLLTEMDGFEKEGNVVVIGATNRPETLDSALMRPGRFSRKVVVGEPDEDGRRKIFGLYLRDVPMEEDKEAICKLVASRTPGLVGADLENIAHESVLLAARRDGDYVTKDDVLEAVERATTKVYNEDGNDNETKAAAYSYGSMAQERVVFGGGSMGFGFSS
ncbi:probable inactive ATP-dependent zinc metalloprotease FTSHI 3, chloroplastic isoform X2 [Cynara cardunculus var. scolymus]|uniref:probable inactive ATP-dependent zinc metalloprotease FTSHI 3, chloroplastic isoform X2 n=1 Tax=Cynara cardunculus var. scolymus TaxID=59895 RepID=UPI000D629DEE|nr:probable inactive ATP-dependent zinc metalloprotease FTSHI 3, chloroplastic isoform X2 [Cynara cardunculus var. scolymus]